jgi:hypothetical protein
MKLLQKFFKWVKSSFEKKPDSNQQEVEDRPRLSQKKIISEFNERNATSISGQVIEPNYHPFNLSSSSNSFDKQNTFTTSTSTCEYPKPKSSTCEYPEQKIRTCEMPEPKIRTCVMPEPKSTTCEYPKFVSSEYVLEEKKKEKSNIPSFDKVLSETVRSEKPQFNNKPSFKVVSNGKTFQVTRKQDFFISQMIKLQHPTEGVVMKSICELFMLHKFGKDAFLNLPKHVLIPKYHKKTINHLIKIGVIVRIEKNNYLFIK